jgi:hypothetical protein
MTLLSLLSPKARALVEAGRGAQRPTASDRERIQSALKSRLGADAFRPEPIVPAPPAAAAGVSWSLLAGVLAGVGVAGGLLYLALRDPSGAEIPARSVPSAITTPHVVEPSSAPAEAPAPAPAPSAGPAPAVAPPDTAPAARAKQDRLAQEVALLSTATKSLNAGRAAEALKVLDEHQRKFPSGLLAEERRAARAQALCSSGRVSEARAELARLAPRSPAAARARQVCDRAREPTR